jgi:putative selenate reductase
VKHPDLYPIPFTTLVHRLDRELAAGGDPVYTLPRRSWWVPDPARDTSLVHHGRRLATPVGPASGPHTQLAQNLLISWLAGGRFMELKTVQVLDDLEIPRPCINVPHVGYNVEWSQELRVAQSATEYAKGWLLVHMLASEHGPGLWSGPDCAFDISLGYDLAGIRSDKVRGYLDTMRDAGELLDGLRAELPPSLGTWADVLCPAQVSDSVTLSTFHGCPADEIEAIARQTLQWGWHTVIKLNPTLYGYDRVRALLDHMGYGFIQIDRADFDQDLQWDQLMDLVPRVNTVAAERGLGFGVKFSNNLVCTSPEPPFEEEKTYLSGPPLHTIALTLAAQFREAWPDIPITFSAGIDGMNVVPVVGAGVGPVTSSTDLLKARGYARMSRYVVALEKAMEKAGVSSIAAYRTSDEARTLSDLAAVVADDPHYHRTPKTKPPKKVGSKLELLDCLTCDKCIPVCPNLANFSVVLPRGEYQPGRVSWDGGDFALSDGETLVVAQKHQIGTTAEACNLCGHCDVWCPEDGGPYIVKPNLFLSEGAFEELSDRDGFLVSVDRRSMWWRVDGKRYAYHRLDDARARLEVVGGAVLLDADVPVRTEGRGEVDLKVAVTMRLFLDAFADPSAGVWLH